jgi:hypothetical protein
MGRHVAPLRRLIDDGNHPAAALSLDRNRINGMSRFLPIIVPIDKRTRAEASRSGKSLHSLQTFNIIYLFIGAGQPPCLPL